MKEETRSDGPFASSQMNAEWRKEQEHKASYGAASSEPQEWTPETVRDLWRESYETPETDSPDSQWNAFFKSVADAINSALAAERETKNNYKREFEDQAHHDGTMTPEVRATLNRSAASGEPQEQWTPERIASYETIHSGWRKNLARDINAALAAEREEREQVERERLDAGEEWSATLETLRNDNNRLRDKLLAAQAGIEKHIKKYCQAHGVDLQNRGCLAEARIYFDLRDKLRSIDLSSLREHDAEVCKPLVEALESAYEAMNHMGDQLNAMDAVEEEDEKYFAAFDKVRAALAQVKEAK